jgi:glycosyltransferase involved in cell wall biosynthesis
MARRVVVRYGSADYVNAKWSLIGRLGFRWCEFQLRWADAVIAVTPSLRERLLERSAAHRVVVIPNAVDTVATTPTATALERFDLAPQGYVLTVGRITWQKDFETLIRAFVAARADEPSLGQLVVVGGDDGTGYLERLLTIADEHVVFTGRLRREELGDLYAHCRLYVNSSRHEGLSNAILEAVSHGCPVIVSDIVENRDLPLTPRHFFPLGDDTALRHKLCEAGRGEVDLTIAPDVFATWPQVVAATRQLYDTLLATPRRDRAPLADAIDNAFGSSN